MCFGKCKNLPSEATLPYHVEFCRSVCLCCCPACSPCSFIYITEGSVLVPDPTYQLIPFKVGQVRKLNRITNDLQSYCTARCRYTKNCFLFVRSGITSSHTFFVGRRPLAAVNKQQKVSIHPTVQLDTYLSLSTKSFYIRLPERQAHISQ